MKRTIICIATLCVMLCGCGNKLPINGSETNNADIVQSDNDESINTENFTQNIPNGEISGGENNSLELTENTEKHTETKEEYLESIKSTYSEIKEEVTTIGVGKTEILFNEVPWESCLLEANSKLKDNAKELQTYLIPEPISVSSRLGISRIGLDQRLRDNDYWNSNVGGVTRPKKTKINVAGYDTEDCILLFSAVEKDGEFVLTNEDSAFYAAQYTIKPVDSETAKEDLKTKISSIYGEPDSVKEIEPYENAATTQEYIYWYGSNDTVLVLTADSGGWIYLSYVWLGGEELLNAALDYAEKQLSEGEESVYGDGNTEGL